MEIPGAPKYHPTDVDNPHLGGNIKGGDPLTFYPEAWKYLVKRFAVKSVLDVGCGEGHATKFFVDLGCTAIGIDGLKANAEKTLEKGCQTIMLDIARGYCKIDVDLVWCCETVEHVAEEHLGNLLRTMSSGRIVAMTPALPGQCGWHHVNCKEQDYWMVKMTALGYAFLQEETGIARNLACRYFKETGLVFKRVRI